MRINLLVRRNVSGHPGVLLKHAVKLEEGSEEIMPENKS